MRAQTVEENLVRGRKGPAFERHDRNRKARVRQPYRQRREAFAFWIEPQHRLRHRAHEIARLEQVGAKLDREADDAHEESYGANQPAWVVAKGQQARLAYVSEFVEYAKASGLVQQAIERSGRIGVTVPA